MMKNNMKRTNKRLLGVNALTLAFLVAFVLGCATTKPADFVQDGFDCNAIESLTVLPVLDHRIDQSKQLDLDDWVLPIAESSLKDRGYPCAVQRDRSLISEISRDAIEAPTKNFIEDLPPASSRWILVLALNDSSSNLTFGSTGNAEMTGYLFDKKNGQLTWRNKELGKVGQGGLIGMAMIGIMERSAIESAAMQMFQTLPIREK